MKIFYIEDENGNYYSADRRRRFIRLTGKEAYLFLRKHRTKTAYFYPTTTEEEAGNKVLIEIPEKSVPRFRKEMNHEKYIADIEKKSPIVCISLLEQAAGEEDLTVQDTIPDESINIEDRVILEIELEMLRRALKTLSDDELRIVHSLYLSHDPLSETKLSEILSIPRTTLRSRRDQIFERIRKFLK